MDSYVKLCPSKEVIFAAPTKYNPEPEVAVKLASESSYKIIYFITTNNPAMKVLTPFGEIGPRLCAVVAIQLKKGTFCKSNDKIDITMARVEVCTVIKDTVKWFVDNCEIWDCRQLSCKCFINHDSEEMALSTPHAAAKVEGNSILDYELVENEEVSQLEHLRNSLVVYPSDELKFSKFSKTENIIIKNASACNIAFILTSVHGANYIITKSKGMIRCGDTQELEIALIGAKCELRDQYLLKILKIEENYTENDLDYLFRNKTSEDVLVYKFWCTWASAENKFPSLRKRNLIESLELTASKSRMIRKLTAVKKCAIKPRGQVNVKYIFVMLVALFMLTGFLYFMSKKEKRKMMKFYF